MANWWLTHPFQKRRDVHGGVQPPKTRSSLEVGVFPSQNGPKIFQHQFRRLLKDDQNSTHILIHYIYIWYSLETIWHLGCNSVSVVLFLNSKCIKYWKVSPVGSHSWNRLIQYFSIHPSRRSTREESAITQFARRKLYVRQYAKPRPTLQALCWRFQAAYPWAGLQSFF